MSFTLRVIGLIGVLLFGTLFVVTFLSPAKIEESAKSFVKYQIEKELVERYKDVTDYSMADAALDFAEKLGMERSQIQSNLENDLPEKIASVIASMCGYDCEKKKLVAKTIASSYVDRIKNIKIAENTLSSIIKNKYIEIIGNLKIDLRIFLGSNFMMFLMLVGVSFAKPGAIQHLFLPGMLLTIATVVSSLIYIFGQDWFYTILYNDYMGFAYLIYIAVIFAFLMDVVFNKGQVTTNIINGIGNAVGSAISVVPC